MKDIIYLIIMLWVAFGFLVLGISQERENWCEAKYEMKIDYDKCLEDGK